MIDLSRVFRRLLEWLSRSLARHRCRPQPPRSTAEYARLIPDRRLV